MDWILVRIESDTAASVGGLIGEPTLSLWFWVGWWVVGGGGLDCILLHPNTALPAPSLIPAVKEELLGSLGVEVAVSILWRVVAESVGVAAVAVRGVVPALRRRVVVAGIPGPLIPC
jgi:hypothetical protein